MWLVTGMAKAAPGDWEGAASGARISGEKVSDLPDPTSPGPVSQAGSPSYNQHMAGVTALIVALTGLIGAIGGIIALFVKARTTQAQVGQVQVQISDVHALVNNQLDRQLIYNQQLAAALTSAGVAVPPQDPPPSPVP